MFCWIVCCKNKRTLQPLTVGLSLKIVILRTPRCWIGRRSCLLRQKTGFDFEHRVDQINISCHRIVTDATLHYVSCHKFRRCLPLIRYISSIEKREERKLNFFTSSRIFKFGNYYPRTNCQSTI